MNEGWYIIVFVAAVAWIGVNREPPFPLLVMCLLAVLVWAILIGSEVSK